MLRKGDLTQGGITNHPATIHIADAGRIAFATML